MHCTDNITGSLSRVWRDVSLHARRFSAWHATFPRARVFLSFDQPWLEKKTARSLHNKDTTFSHLHEILSSKCKIFPAGKSCSAETGGNDVGSVSTSSSAKYLWELSPVVSPAVSSRGYKEHTNEK